ncbi:MAG: hypothetical protein ACE5I2_00625 [Anaerolineae bacterium]
MTRIRCQLDECVFWFEGFCSSEEIELDPELGCLTLMGGGDPDEEEEEEWGDEELFGEDEWEEEL